MEPILVECPRCGRLAPEYEFGLWLDTNEPPTCCSEPNPQRRIDFGEPKLERVQNHESAEA